MCEGSDGCRDIIWRISGSTLDGAYCCADGCHRTWDLEPWHFPLIAVLSWFGFFLLVGLIFNMIGSRNLMIGSRAPRGIPGAFLCLLPILSFLLVFALWKGYSAKRPEERADLRKQWDGMSFGRKISSCCG